MASAFAATAELGDTRAAELLSQAGPRSPPRPVHRGRSGGTRGRRSPSTIPNGRRLLAQQVMLLGRPVAPSSPRHRRTRPDRRRHPARKPRCASVCHWSLPNTRTSTPRAHRHRAGVTRSARPVSAPDCLPPTPSPRSWSNDFDGLRPPSRSAMQTCPAVDDTATQDLLLATLLHSGSTPHAMGFRLRSGRAGPPHRRGHRRGSVDMGAKGLCLGMVTTVAGRPVEYCGFSDAALRDHRRASPSGGSTQGAAINLWMMIRVTRAAWRQADSATPRPKPNPSSPSPTGANAARWPTTPSTSSCVASRSTPEILPPSNAPSPRDRDARRDVGTVRRQGKWLAAIDADADGRPDRSLDMLTESIALYGGLDNPSPSIPPTIPCSPASPAAPADRDLAARAAVRRERRAKDNPKFPLLAAVACTRAPWSTTIPTH